MVLLKMSGKIFVGFKFYELVYIVLYSSSVLCLEEIILCKLGLGLKVILLLIF